MGKGDKQRPSAITKKQFDKNWDKIFKKNFGKSGILQYPHNSGGD